MAYTKKKTKKSASGNRSAALPDRNVTEDEEHAKLIIWVNEADDATLYSRELSEKCRGYYDTHGQWTDAERAKLAAQKQAATVINRVKPKVDSLMGMERANRTTAKAWPRTPKHAQGATAATEAVRFCLQDNLYERHRSDAWENLLIEGTGGVEIIVKPKDEGYKILIRHIMWDRILYDPHSRRKDFSDARFLGQVVWMDYDEAVALYPQAGDVLEAMQTGSETYDDKPRWMDTTRRRVKIVEMYYRKADGDWWYACFTRGGYCKAPMKSPYLNEEGETESAYEFASLFVDREGGRYGSLKQLLDVQDEINKRRSKALHLMSVRQVRWERGAVEDINKARQELAKPDGVLETTPGMEFEILKTGDMAAAQFNLLTEAKMEIDAVGANAATMGKDKTVQSGVALRQRALTGQTELAPMFDILKNLDIRVYRKVWNRVKQYWRAEMWLRVTDDENNLKFVGLNKPVTQGEQLLQQAQAQGAPPEMLAQLQARIAADPAMQQVVSTENDIVNLDVDIVMDDAPDTVTQEVEDFQAMAEMVKSGFPLPPEAVIMASPLSNKDRILKMMKESPQIPPQVQEQVERMQEDFKKLQAEHQKIGEENKALKADQSSEAAKLQLRTQEAQAQLTLQKAKQEGEAALAQAKAEAEFALKKYVAEQEMALEARRCENDKKMATDKMDFEKKVKSEEMLPDEVKKAYIKNEIAQTDIMPALLEQLGSAFGQMGESLQQLVTLQEQTLRAILAPKRVSIGALSRNPEGIVSGANVTVTPVTVN